MKEKEKYKFLSQNKLGKPVFSVKFLLDMYKMAEHDGLERVAKFFKEKVQKGVTAK